MGALGLDDGVQADARIGQGAAHRCCGAGAIGELAHTHLGLIQVQGHTADGRFIGACRCGLTVELLVCQFKHLGGRAQGLGALMARHQATHLHFAGGDQAQVDACLRQGVEEFGGHPWSAQDAGSRDAQLGHAPLGPELGSAGPQIGAELRQHLAADQLGLIKFGLGEGEGNVVGEAAVV